MSDPPGGDFDNEIKEDTININGVLFRIKRNIFRNVPTPEPQSEDNNILIRSICNTSVGYKKNIIDSLPTYSPDQLSDEESEEKIEKLQRNKDNPDLVICDTCGHRKIVQEFWEQLLAIRNSKLPAFILTYTMNKRKSNSSEMRTIAKRRKYAEIKADPELWENQREKEREKYRKKKMKGQVISINEKSPREIRQQRKKWREASKKYRQKKKQDHLKGPSIPQPVIIECPESDSNERLTSSIPAKDPLQSEINIKIRKIRYQEFKKRKMLINIIQTWKNRYTALNKKVKILEKKLQDKEITVNQKEKPVEKLIETKKEQKGCSQAKKMVSDFYTWDCNSTVKAGKKEYITRNGIKKQKRYLNSPLNILYNKFLATHKTKISYAYFCANRPFWVLFPKLKDRETCVCMIHCNVDLVLDCLNKASIIAEKNSEELLAAVCCLSHNEHCLSRQCSRCKNKTITYNEFSNNQILLLHQWERSQESYITKSGIRKVVSITTKKATRVSPLQVISILEKLLEKFFDHALMIRSQYVTIKKLREGLKVNEALLHIDFSENYALKFGTEVQSFHFGGSRKEVCIHTAVLYTFDFHASSTGTTSICTISQCLRHDAPAVWAHLIPLLKATVEKNPFIDTLNILSDSPTAQYRNKYIFHMITEFDKDFPQIKCITWNYTEAGHGKGAPDGVGAVLKRTADKLVTFGHDIGTFDQFFNTVEKFVDNIQIMKVEEKEVIERDNKMPKNLKPFSGTLSVHQVIWSKNCDKLTFRKSSCFSCGPGEVCIHGKHLGFLKINKPIPEPNPANENSQLDVVSLASTKKKVPRSSTLTNITNKPIPSTSQGIFIMSGKDAKHFIITSKQINKKNQ